MGFVSSAKPRSYGFDAPDYMTLPGSMWAANQLLVEYRGDDRWAITHGSRTNYTREGNWEFEPMNSNKTDEFLARARYSLEEALEIAEKLFQSAVDWRDPKVREAFMDSRESV